MPERTSVSSRPIPHRGRIVAGLLAIGVAVGVAACTENLDGGAACPSLCPAQTNLFRDTTIDATVLDTTISGFPTLGLAATMLVANRKDTVETSGIIRFDALPTAFTPNGTGDTATITAIDSVYLRVVLDSTGARGASQVQLTAYDVDTLELPNAVPAVVRTLFRPDRILGSAVLTPTAARDTFRIPLSKVAVLAKIKGQVRLRIGLRISGTTSSQVRIVSFAGGGASPQLAFDPTTDTTYLPVGIAPSTTILGAAADELAASTVYTIVDKGTPDPGAQTLSVGGAPSRRAYLRFNLPKSISDSSTVVRAELLLTQRKSTGVDRTDSIAVVPLIGTATTRVTDIRRAMDLAAEGFYAGLDSIRLVPGDSTTRTLNVLALVRSWSGLSIDVVRAIVLRVSHEGSEPAEARFYSSEAPAALRPRLHITYLPKVEAAVP